MSRVFGFKRSLKEDNHESSVPRTVNVDDFGAKGNGKDDTNVSIANNFLGYKF